MRGVHVSRTPIPAFRKKNRNRSRQQVPKHNSCLLHQGKSMSIEGITTDHFLMCLESVHITEYMQIPREGVLVWSVYRVLLQRVPACYLT